MSRTLMPRADFLSALVFFVLAVYMVVEGLGMPGAGGFIEAGGEPGKVPILLGAILAFFSVILLCRSISEQGYRLLRKSKSENAEPRGALRSVLTAAGCSFYAIGLLGASFMGRDVLYHEATALFIFLFIVGFEWSEASELGPLRWRWLQEKLPSVATFLQKIFSFIDADRAPYVWVIASALIQAILVSWGVTYLFEQEFYVKLP